MRHALVRLAALLVVLMLVLTGCNLIGIDPIMQLDEDFAKLKKQYSGVVASYDGGEITQDEKPTPVQEAHAAWKQFRKAVYDTQEFLHDPTYMGGFDEDWKIEQSPYTAADPTTALMLTTRLQNANAKCVYRSGLIGLGQPAWYFEAWRHTDEDDPEEE